MTAAYEAQLAAAKAAPAPRTPPAGTQRRRQPAEPVAELKPRKANKHEEDDLQAAVVRWWQHQYPEFAGLLFAIPNGGQRSAREGARLKAQGVTAGVPDLLLAKPRYDANGHVVSAGLWLELKVGKNKPSPQQRTMLALLVTHGYAAVVAYDFHAAKVAIVNHIGY